MDNEKRQIIQEVQKALDKKQYDLNFDYVSLLDVAEYIHQTRQLEGHEYYTAFEWIASSELYYPEYLISYNKNDDNDKANWEDVNTITKIS